MTFGDKIRQLRRDKGLTLRGLSKNVGIGFAYLSRVETGNLTYGDYPSEALIHRLADALYADENSLLLLAEKIPKTVRERVLQLPDAFLAIAACDDRTLDKLLSQLRRGSLNDKPHRVKRRNNTLAKPLNDATE
jgi:transcriptional regulator with XRE-family HTH domain